jgi:hypothetical protein
MTASTVGGNQSTSGGSARVVTVARELLYDRHAVSILRLNGTPRSGVDGRHRNLVAHVAPTVSTAETVRLLHDAAEALAKSLPTYPTESL